VSKGMGDIDKAIGKARELIRWGRRKRVKLRNEGGKTKKKGHKREVTGNLCEGKAPQEQRTQDN